MNDIIEQQHNLLVSAQTNIYSLVSAKLYSIAW